MTRCIATPRRVHWALLQTGWDPEKVHHYELAAVEGRLGFRSAERICEAADVPFAALFAPDPSRWEMFRAWLRGLRA